jgi:hypothetical protein
MGDASDCVILEDGTALRERLARMPGVPVDFCIEWPCCKDLAESREMIRIGEE